MGFSVLLSPFTLIVWPLSVARVQLPPDCFRQPRIVVCWPELDVELLVAVPGAVWLEGICEVVDGLDWSVDDGCCEDGCCADGCC